MALGMIYIKKKKAKNTDVKLEEAYGLKTH